jgi:surface antigen
MCPDNRTHETGPTLRIMQTTPLARRLFLVPALALGLGLAGCSSNRQGGTIIGAVGGALLGSQFGSGGARVVATVVGALAGAWIGSEIGRSLDERDRRRHRETAQSALDENDPGETATWANSETGHSGSTTPGESFSREGRTCRNFEQTVTVEGETEVARGVACKQPDGSWQVVDA